MEKKKIEERKTALQNQHDDVAQKITQGKNALGNLEATLMGIGIFLATALLVELIVEALTLSTSTL